MQETEIILPQIAEGEDKSSPFANRVRNQYRHLRKWAKRTFTDCFRIYDREVPHYPVAIDLYAGRFCVHYFSPGRDYDDPPETLFNEVNQTLTRIFSVSDDQIFWRIRAKNKETRQYEKISESQDFFVAKEYGLKFKINLIDYLDTGLFLDHRETRRLVGSYAKDKRVLNLFAYTCAFSIHAASAGANYTKSVDMSNTYTQWGRDNFYLNGIPAANHPIIRADCLKFLKAETENYDIIVIDPPTISRSKKMDQLFDIQEDYLFLINQSIKLLNTQGIIFFSTNSRKFKFDESQFVSCKINEITERTIPIDFQNSNIHRCWKIEPQ